jgi:hypothetical protein
MKISKKLSLLLAVGLLLTPLGLHFAARRVDAEVRRQSTGDRRQRTDGGGQRAGMQNQTEPGRATNPRLLVLKLSHRLDCHLLAAVLPASFLP